MSDNTITMLIIIAGSLTKRKASQAVSMNNLTPELTGPAPITVTRLKSFTLIILHSHLLWLLQTISIKKVKGRQASDLPKIDDLQIDIIMNAKFLSLLRGALAGYKSHGLLDIPNWYLKFL